MFKYINFLLLAILLLIFSCEEIMPVIIGCTIESACNYNADATVDDDTCVYKQGCNQWCNGDEGEPQVFDCSSECGGDRVEDNCGTCDNDSSNDCVQDCANDWGGSAVVDVCDVCGGDGSSCTDCNGDINGTAVEDECGVCDATYETQPVFPYGDCDCNGDLDGEASIDGCEDCVGGDTGLTACANDCLGVIGGDAVYDNCGEECVAVDPEAGCSEHCDNNPDNDCVQDCDDKWGGEAVEDNCSNCVGGNTGLTPCVQDCAGNWGGLDGVADTGDEAANDECGICDATYETQPAFPYGNCDCNGTPNGDAYINGCGDCAVEGNHPECPVDCAEVEGGTNFVDNCSVCVPAGDTSCVLGCDNLWCNTLNCAQLVDDECGVCGGDNSTCADCAETPNGEAIIDDCGVCSGGNSGHQFNSDIDECGECGGDKACFGCNVWYMENFICDEDGAEKCCSKNSDEDARDKCILRDNNNNAGCSLSTFCQLEYEIDCDENDEFCDYDGAYIGEPCSTTSGSFIAGEGKCKNKCFGGPTICSDINCSEPGFCDYSGAVIGSTCSTTSGSFIEGEGECKLYTTNDIYHKTGYITYNNTRCEDGDDCCEVPECDGILLSIELINATTLQVSYSSTEAIGGFQFEIVGATTTGGSGGDADANGLSIGFGSNNLVLGFSLDASTMPDGEGILTNLTVTIDPSTENLCLQNVIFSDPNGIQIVNCPEYEALWPVPGQQVECITIP